MDEATDVSRSDRGWVCYLRASSPLDIVAEKQSRRQGGPRSLARTTGEVTEGLPTAGAQQSLRAQIQGVVAVQLSRHSRSLFRFGRWRVCLAGIAFLVFAGSAWAQNYPSRPIRIVVPTQAGAAQDII